MASILEILQVPVRIHLTAHVPFVLVPPSQEPLCLATQLSLCPIRPYHLTVGMSKKNVLSV